MDSLLMTAIWIGVSAAAAWLAKEIIKPWSDAYLLRSQAFVKYVETQGLMTSTIALESQKQTVALLSIESQTRVQTSTLATTGNQIAEMNSEQKKLCKADHGLSDGKLSEFLEHITSIQESVEKSRMLVIVAAKEANDELLKKARDQAIELIELAAKKAASLATADSQ